MASSSGTPEKGEPSHTLLPQVPDDLVEATLASISNMAQAASSPHSSSSTASDNPLPTTSSSQSEATTNSETVRLLQQLLVSFSAMERKQSELERKLLQDSASDVAVDTSEKHRSLSNLPSIIEIPNNRFSFRSTNDEIKDFVAQLKLANVPVYANTKDQVARIEIISTWVRIASSLKLESDVFCQTLSHVLPTLEYNFYRDLAVSKGEDLDGYIMCQKLANKINHQLKTPLDSIGQLFRQRPDETPLEYFERSFKSSDAKINTVTDRRRDVFNRVATGLVSPALSTALLDAIKRKFLSDIDGESPMETMPHDHLVAV